MQKSIIALIIACYSLVVFSHPLLVQAKTFQKNTYFRNATGVYDNTILQHKGGYFSNATGSYLQLANGTITNSPATGLCNIMSDVYKAQFPTQCGNFASPFK